MAEPTHPSSGGLRIAPHLDLEDTKLLPTDPSAERPVPLFAERPTAPSPLPAPQRNMLGRRRRLLWWITLTALILVAARVLLR